MGKFEEVSESISTPEEVAEDFALREVVLDLVDGGWVEPFSEQDYYHLLSVIGVALARTEESPVYTARSFSWEE